jgi:uncharacterized phage protein (TIGR02218 family)
MRSLNIDLTARVLFPVRLVKLTRLDGTILRIAEHDTSLTVDGNAFSPLKGCEISAIEHMIGGDVPSVEIKFAHSSGGTIDTEAVARGLWDGADVLMYLIDRTSISTLGDPIFTGSIQPVQFDINGRGTFDCRGHAAKAESFIQTYQPMCRTDVGSELCQVDLSTFAKTCAVASIIDKFNITVSGMASPPADDWFNQGHLVAASGKKFEIARWVNSSSKVTFYLPVADLLEAAESLTLYPGCDKTAATCLSKFSNIINFQGEPHFLGAAAALGN